MEEDLSLRLQQIMMHYLVNSSCVSCGACAHTCPTDAISDVYQSKSVAVDEKVRTTCSYCGVGCNLEASIKDNKVVAISTPERI